MPSTTDAAADVRAKLKAKGYNSRKVSVRAEYYSMGSSLHVKVKDADVPLAVVESIANEHEKIDRDQWGEILSGGNRYVHVGYSHDAADIIRLRYKGALESAAAHLADYGPDTRCLVDIADTGFRLGRGYNGYGVSLWGDSGHIQSANEAEHLAVTLAVAIQKKAN